MLCTTRFEQGSTSSSCRRDRRSDTSRRLSSLPKGARQVNDEDVFSNPPLRIWTGIAWEATTAPQPLAYLGWLFSRKPLKYQSTLVSRVGTYWWTNETHYSKKSASYFCTSPFGFLVCAWVCVCVPYPLLSPIMPPINTC